MDEEKLTWSDIMRGFAEIVEAEKRRAETERLRAEAERLRAEEWAETERCRLEADKKRWAEAERLRAEDERLRAEDDKKRQEEYDKRQAKLDAKIAALTASVNGISDSNGMFAEELFFNTLSEKKGFAGIHFDDVADDFKCMVKQPDGTRLKDQFDIVMLNDVAVAIIEVKYRARKADVETLAGQKVKNFKILFPAYKDLNVYLGLGALAFEDDVVNEARKYGIGLLKQVGDTVEYAADWAVKAY